MTASHCEMQPGIDMAYDFFDVHNAISYKSDDGHTASYMAIKKALKSLNGTKGSLSAVPPKLQHLHQMVHTVA